MNCLLCEKEIVRKPNEAKLDFESRKYCDQKCSQLHRKGRKRNEIMLVEQSRKDRTFINPLLDEVFHLSVKMINQANQAAKQNVLDSLEAK